MARPRKHPAGAQTPLLTADAAPLPEIPVAEQPYPLPKGWKWVRLGDLTQIVGGGTPPSNNKEFYEDGEIPWLSPADLSNYMGIYIAHGKKMITAAGLMNSSARMVPAETVCLSSRAPIGYVVIAQNPLCTNQGFKNFLPSPSYIPKFLYWYFKGNKNLLESYASGTTFLELSASKVAQVVFPLPPREEQERIVARIESLFAKLDEAREKIVAVAERYEPRRAALLHKAFSGELTAKWREEKGNAAGWKNVLFSDVADIKSNLVDPADFQTFPHIAPDNIEKKTGILLQYNTVAEDKVTSGKHRFYPGQILYSKIRPYLSKVVIVDFDGLCSADMYPIDAKENTKYLWYYMLSEEFLEQASTAGSRSVLPKINQKELSRIRIPLPPLPEQEEIVRLLDGLLERERQIREAAEQVRERIDLMKKAILARAFRGELGEDGGATH